MPPHSPAPLRPALPGALTLALLGAPACVIERIDALLEEHGVTWVPDSTTTSSSTSTGSSSSSGSPGDPDAASTLADSGDGSTGGVAEGSTLDLASSTSSSSTLATDTGSVPDPVCGDGILNGDETCDDQNDDPSDGCKLCARDSVIFVTSQSYQGGKLNGLDGATQRCRMLAAIAGLDRFETFLPWLSDQSSAAADRLLHSRGRYVLVNGLVVADDWDQLTSGALQHPIDVDENSQTKKAGVWTGTLPNGQISPGTQCGDWTDQANGQTGGWGVSSEATAYWSFVESTDCGDFRPLYCVEQ